MKNKKIILHIIGTLGQGGAEAALYRLLRFSKNHKLEVVLMVLSNHGYYSDKITALGIKIIYLNFKRAKILSCLHKMISIIREIKPDIVQTWMYHADLLGGVCAKIARVKKIIWGIRCEGVGLTLKAKIVKQLCAVLSWIIPDVIVANSYSAEKQHIQSGYCPKRFQVIQNGFNADEFFSQPDKTFLKLHIQQELPKDAVVFGTLARYHADKDYLSLISIIDTVCQYNTQAYFVLCGNECNKENLELLAAIKNIKYSSHIILINGTDNVVAYLNAVDIFVLPSRTESFPNALAEAMLCELACIATDVGDVKYFLQNTGMLIPPGNAEKLAAACITMLKMSAMERKQMGMQARDRIKQDFSMQANIQKFIAIYK